MHPSFLMHTRTTRGLRAPVVIASLIGVVGSTAAWADVDWHGGNQLEYSLASEGGREVLENWFDLEWSSGPLAAGVRYELYHPHEERPDSVTEGFSIQYLTYAEESVSVTVGNFYALFGRGLALRTFEDRGVRRDTNLEGVRLDLTSGPADLTLLSGRVRNSRGVRRDLLHGLDLDVAPLSFGRIGLSYLSNRDPEIPHSSPNELATGRLSLTFGPVDLYAEHGQRSGPPAFSAQGRRHGWGTYAAASLASRWAGLSVEYKDYRRFEYLMSDRSSKHAYNLPPAVLREHSFTLLNRHPHELDPDDERGYLAELVTSAGRWGDMIVSSGRTENQTGDVLFRETYLQWDRAVGGRHLTVAADFADRPGQEETTLVGEATVSAGAERALKVQVQHQHVKGPAIGEYDDDLVALEFSPSYDLSVSVTGEWTNKSELQRADPDQRTSWLYALITRNLGSNHYVSLMYGTRQAGFVCAGGVCREEPEFDGLEFKLFSTF